MPMIESLKAGFRKTFVYDGRASQAEFWWFYLWLLVVQLAVSIVLSLVTVAIAFLVVGVSATQDSPEGAIAGFGFVFLLYGLIFLVSIALTLPLLSATARRLHDTGQTGWLVLLNLAGLGIIPLIMCIFEGQPFENQWGPVPEA